MGRYIACVIMCLVACGCPSESDVKKIVTDSQKEFTKKFQEGLPKLQAQMRAGMKEDITAAVKDAMKDVPKLDEATQRELDQARRSTRSSPANIADSEDLSFQEQLVLRYAEQKAEESRAAGLLPIVQQMAGGQAAKQEQVIETLQQQNALLLQQQSVAQQKEREEADRLRKQLELREMGERMRMWEQERIRQEAFAADYVRKGYLVTDPALRDIFEGSHCVHSFGGRVTYPGFGGFRRY